MKELQEGNKAPEITFADKDGNTKTLNDYAGRKLILYFYPRDNTPGCTVEACDLRDNYARWTTDGYEVIGVSPDSMASHLKFAEKHNLPFPLIADTDKVVAQAFGAWGEKKSYGKTYMGLLRTTFVIDEQGTIQKIIRKVKTKEHSLQIQQELEKQ